jgi:chromosome segregation ATPase
VREDQEVSDDVALTAPIRLPGGAPAAADEPAERATSTDPAPVRAFRQDVERLSGLVAQLVEAAGALGVRLDGEVGEVLGSAEKAFAEAREARREAAQADILASEAEARAEVARQEAVEAQEELRKGLAAAKASVTAAQESEANAWREAGAHQQARATSANEAASAEGLRKRAEAAWSTEHQARIEAERERDDLAARLSTDQAALATARSELVDARAELVELRAKLEAAAESERRLRAELSVVQGEVAGLTVERDAATARADDLAERAERAEKLADTADARIDTERARADRAEERADAAEIRIDRDAATVRALQDTLRAALDLPSVEDLADGRGVQVGDVGAVTVQPGGLVGVDQVPELMDGELAGRFARAILAVRVHQATRRAVEESQDEPTETGTEE